MVAEIGDSGKVCNGCGIYLPLKNFSKHKYSRDGYKSTCKKCIAAKRAEIADCENAKRRADYASDPDKYKKRSKDYAERNREKVRSRKRRYSELNREKILRKHREYNKSHPENKRKRYTAYPEKSKARSILQHAIRRGEIKRLPCCVCGNIKSEGHHDDYSKPLEVVWLCRKHHSERHIEIRDKENKYE